jgi:serine/threonine-protein kinase
MDHEVLRELGSGGMGKVYQVRNLISGRLEALKVLRPELTSVMESSDRFLREIKIAACLDHPNIAALRTAFRWKDNRIAMLMEFVNGMSLEKRMTANRLPLREAVSCVSQILSALSYAHNAGIVHRDIKPANIICEPSGRTKLLDFGLAVGASSRSVTGAGTVLGSVYYMSPEQIQGRSVDRRADIYSMGVALYELVTGTKPFQGASDYSIMSAHLNSPARPPVEVTAGISWELSEIILTAMHKDPNDRFQSADAFRTALASLR